MAEIIAFPSRELLQRQALDKLGAQITRHLAGVFYEKNILDVPVQGLVKKMCEIMINDGFNQDVAVIARIQEMPDAMASIAESFVTVLIQHGYLPEGFTLN